MSALESKVDRRSDSFKQNTSDMMSMLAQLETCTPRLRLGAVKKP